VIRSAQFASQTARTNDLQRAMSRNSARQSVWTREIPFSLVLVLTILGVAYTSFSKQPMIVYWEIVAPIIGLVCVATGWQSVDDKAGRIRLIATQALHWLAFLVVMNLMLLPSVQKTFSASATGLAIFTLLALGTFTAGVHVLSWQICLLGLIMALGIPAIAWIENSALVVILILAAVLGIGIVLWWRWHETGKKHFELNGSMS
jgi:Flp pilus assembly protein TadB